MCTDFIVFLQEKDTVDGFTNVIVFLQEERDCRHLYNVIVLSSGGERDCRHLYKCYCFVFQEEKEIVDRCTNVSIFLQEEKDCRHV